METKVKNTEKTEVKRQTTVKLTSCSNYTQQFYADYMKKNNLSKLTNKNAKQCRQKQRTKLFKIVDNCIYTNAKLLSEKQIVEKLKTDKNICIDFMKMYKHNYLLVDFNANNMFKGGEDKIKQLQLFLNAIKLYLSTENKKEKTNTEIKTEIKTETTQQ